MKTTPYLEIDLAQLRSNYREFVAALPDVQAHYAVKCNPDPQVLRSLHELGCRFEVASYPELKELMELGVDSREVLFSNPVKAPDHIARAWAAGLWRFAFDSTDELRKLSVIAPGAGATVRLKVENFASEVPSEGKFGVRPAQAVELMVAARDMGLVPYGVAFHVGSQMLKPGAWNEAIAQACEVMRELKRRGITIQMLDIGGGFPSAYSGYEPDLEEFGAAIQAALKRHLPYPVELTAEPGRAMVASAGVMVATVIGMAEREGKRWIHLDVGAFNGMMEALESQNKLLFPVSCERGGKLSPANLTGPSCDSQDTILFDVALSEKLETGDRIYIHSAGAYTTSYASNFNGFDIPKIYCTEHSAIAA